MTAHIYHAPQMSTDPYTPPKITPDGESHLPRVTGRPCPSCGSRNTGREELLHRKPGVLWFMLFGWLFLLLRTAFIRRADSCRDCGDTFRYRTVGSWVALALLALWVLVVIDYFWFYTQQT